MQSLRDKYHQWSPFISKIYDPMLRFFLAIRKKLIEQENIRKYLLYAIGEILLVVALSR